MQKAKTVEELLQDKKKSKRPMTYNEIIMELNHVKSQRAIANEIKKMLKFGVIKKVTINIENKKFEMYSLNL